MNAPSPVARRRGQPAWALLLLLVGWVALRWLTWLPMASLVAPRAPAIARSAGRAISPDLRPAIRPTLRPAVAAAVTLAPAWPLPAPTGALPVQAPLAAPTPAAAVVPRGVAIDSWPTTPPAETAPAAVASGPASGPVSRPESGPTPAKTPLRVVSAHAILWMAAVCDLPLPPGMLAVVPPLAPAAPIRPDSAASFRRWSADGWMMVRPDGGSAGLAAGVPTYGASQLGAVIRYRLASGGMRPAGYLRATAALEATAGSGAAERGLAAGLSLRPIAAVPVRIMAEARADRFADGRTHMRAAVFAVTEAAPITLPAGTRAEFYAQAGYVAGAAATGFVDGQLRLDRVIAKAEAGELRAGAGAWGGAQRGSSRLDLGPTASIAVVHGPASARVAFDWRFRVAGNAAPASGPALTISAGF